MSKDDADAKAARERQSTALGAVVGQNVRRIREERLITQGELGDLWKAHGLNWARSKISALESGHRYLSRRLRPVGVTRLVLRVVVVG